MRGALLAGVELAAAGPVAVALELERLAPTVG